MVKFVWLEAGDGGLIPVNPDQVQFLRPLPSGKVGLVFGAMPGAHHELTLAGPVGSIVHVLEGGPPGAAEAASPRADAAADPPPGPPARPRKRRTAKAAP